MAEALFYEALREADLGVCWRYVNTDEGLGRSKRNIYGQLVCIQERGHDGGVHEEQKEIAGASDG